MLLFTLTGNVHFLNFYIFFASSNLYIQFSSVSMPAQLKTKHSLQNIKDVYFTQKVI